MHLSVKFMHLAFARMPGESYRKRLVLLLRSCDGQSALIRLLLSALLRSIALLKSDVI